MTTISEAIQKSIKRMTEEYGPFQLQGESDSKFSKRLLDGVNILTNKEMDILELLEIAWNIFMELPEMHDQHCVEFMRAIHAAQHLVLIRPTKRTLAINVNDWFYSSGEGTE